MPGKQQRNANPFWRMERIAGKLRVLVPTVTSLAALTQELVKAGACVIALPDAGPAAVETALWRQAANPEH